MDRHVYTKCVLYLSNHKKYKGQFYGVKYSKNCPYYSYLESQKSNQFKKSNFSFFNRLRSQKISNLLIQQAQCISGWYGQC